MYNNSQLQYKEYILKKKELMQEIDNIVFNEQGLVPCVVQSSDNNDVLMLAWMSRETLLVTINSGYATYWSRSRGEIWIKGQSSGNKQKVNEIMIDCDKDCILLKVDQKGVACHTGEWSCFFNQLY